MRLVTRLQSRARAVAFSFGVGTRRKMSVEMTAHRKGRKLKLPWRSGERGEDFSTQRARREENAKNAKVAKGNGVSLSLGKSVLSEYWPLGVEMTDERLNRWNKTPRYVFGMDKSGSPWVYRFLGIYQLARREENHLVYTRQCEVLRRDEVENSLNPGNY